MSIFDVNASNLFSASLIQTTGLDNLANRALNAGLEAYTAKKFDEAIPHFRRAAALYPKSDIANNAFEYMARAYTQLEDREGAIKTYQQSLRQDPRQSAVHVALGNVLVMAERLDAAVAAYEKAVKLDPSVANRYSLGQGYLAVGRLQEAEQQFALVRQMTPREPQGHVGLGQTYAKQGRHEDAIRAFQQAIDQQRDYWTAYSEMGYALVDDGQVEQAREIVATLQPRDAALADSLAQYLYEKAAPRMTAAVMPEGFTAFFSSKGPGTLLTELSPQLASPDSEHLFAMSFRFDKPMDRISVQDVNNWQIGRTQGPGRINQYNFGHPLPDTEVMPPERPLMVFYNEAENTATVLFLLRQNSQGNGTMDPQHIQFSFRGQDVLGTAMDSTADDYTGFSGFA